MNDVSEEKTITLRQNVFKQIAKSPKRLMILIVSIVLAVVFFALAGVIGVGNASSSGSSRSPYKTSGALKYGTNSSVKCLTSSTTYYSYKADSSNGYYTFTINSPYAVSVALRDKDKKTLISDSGKTPKLRAYLKKGETYYLVILLNGSASSTASHFYASVVIT